ncbi:thioredoxin family protein [Spirulina sp. 06S082]|uniref:thioredoxin family protein n=1 Tax=Spirulina sp. 06S082 TaxID=3110248 RepID=UPI002B1F6028|nr:thioredoxin family protein [Spirulina sp. 06S082]MEA5468569.1 thioredoxin family protein [Spirulina sp. 06S082]
MNNRLGKIAIALVAFVLSFALFFALQTERSDASLDSQAKAAIPLEIALENGKPSLMEFYATWCTSCQVMAGDLQALKGEYGDAVNFVMLNVDNNKWLPEIFRYRVDGIPHFVYLDRQGETVGESLGEQPRSILEADLQALIADVTLPYANTTGKVSQFDVQIKPNATPEDPRSHSSQVQVQES